MGGGAILLQNNPNLQQWASMGTLSCGKRSNDIYFMGIREDKIKLKGLRKQRHYW